MASELTGRDLERRLAEAEAQLAAVDSMVGGLLRERELTFEGERAVSILALVNWLEGQTRHKVSIVESQLAEAEAKTEELQAGAEAYSRIYQALDQILTEAGITFDGGPGSSTQTRKYSTLKDRIVRALREREELLEQRALLRKALEALRYLAKESSIGVAAVRAEWGNALCKFCEEMDEYTSWDPTGMRRANASMEAFLAERGKGERREQ